uniref:Secreted protein n=1 Tax=Ascaris lumbricoides TaxID=6252 RepID=A0A0M3ILC5_ASCLU
MLVHLLHSCFLRISSVCFCSSKSASSLPFVFLSPAINAICWSIRSCRIFQLAASRRDKFLEFSRNVQPAPSIVLSAHVRRSDREISLPTLPLSSVRQQLAYTNLVVPSASR